MDTAGLALSAVQTGTNVVKAMYEFCKDYRDVPKEVESLTRLVESWNSIFLVIADHLGRSRGNLGPDITGLPAYVAMKEQLNQSRRCWDDLSDELKITPEAARDHDWKRVRQAFKKTKLRHIAEELKRHGTILFGMASWSMSKKLDQVLAELRESTVGFQERVDQRHAQEEKERILSWISDNLQDQFHDEHLFDFQEGTLEKVLHADEYFDWQNGALQADGRPAAPPILWYTGPPGAGKSTMVAAVVERLRKCYSNDAIVIVVYCRYNNHRSQSTRNMLAYMIRSALSRITVWPGFIFDIWREHEVGRTQLPLQSLHDILCRLLSSRRKAFILVDALDELTDVVRGRSEERIIDPHSVIEEIVAVMEELNSAHTRAAELPCRAFFTSREDSHKQYSREQVRQISFEASSKDVSLMINRKIEKKVVKIPTARADQKPDLQKDIVSRISANAGGVFLLAALQLEHLRTCMNLRDLKDRLDDLPQDLFDSHGRSLERIQNQPMEHSTKALAAISLVYHSKGMLQAGAARQALAVRDEDVIFHEDGVDTDEILVSITAGLLSVKSGVLGFVHHSVKEFFSHWQLPAPKAISVRWGHGYIASQCLRFLNLEDFQEPVELSQRGPRLQAFPFLDYAIKNVGYHIHRSTSEEGRTYALTRRCHELLDQGGPPWGCFQEFLARMVTNPVPERVKKMAMPKLHYAVLCNFIGVARDLLSPQTINEVATQKRETVLHFAARIYSKEMVEMILEQRPDREIVNYSGKTPLDMILGGPLLRHNVSPPGPQADVPRPAQTEGAAKTAAESEKDLIIPRVTAGLLLFCSPYLSLQRGDERVPFQDVIDNVQASLITSKIENMIDKKVKLTLPEEGEEVARVFINADVDLNSRQMCQETPLQLAALYELPGLVSLLLEKGANPFLTWHCKLTAKEIAERQNNTEILTVLRRKEEEIDALEARAPDNAAKLDIPGRLQAEDLVRQGRQSAPRRAERLHAPILDMLRPILERHMPNTDEPIPSTTSAPEGPQDNPPSADNGNTSGGELRTDSFPPSSVNTTDGRGTGAEEDPSAGTTELRSTSESPLSQRYEKPRVSDDEVGNDQQLYVM